MVTAFQGNVAIVELHVNEDIQREQTIVSSDRKDFFAMKPLDEKDSKVPPSLIIAQITVRGHLASVSLSVSCCCQAQAD